VKVIIAGSRDLDQYDYVDTGVLNSGYVIAEVVSGGARGPDKIGEEWADLHNIPVKGFPADWDKYGKSAGIHRNIEMAEYADALIAIWDGKSKGTLHMITAMVSKKKPVFVYCPT
jgi:hypothetical protein